MFYTTAKNDHGLPHDPFKGLIVPRPIGWISTQSPRGELNLAPYSYFNAVSDQPKLVMFSSQGPKDSATFAEESGAFAANFVSANLTQQMNLTSVSAPRGTDEFRIAGLTPVPCELVAAMRVKEAFACMECRVTQVVRPENTSRPTNTIIVFGEVLAIHIDEAILTNGRVDIAKAQPVTRLGYMDFAIVETVFELFRPKWPLPSEGQEG
jgi:flavin reductase (DIM6/NTAB) family NADH-FMN oxidoreductase RutF